MLWDFKAWSESVHLDTKVFPPFTRCDTITLSDRVIRCEVDCIEIMAKKNRSEERFNYIK